MAAAAIAGDDLSRASTGSRRSFASISRRSWTTGHDVFGRSERREEEEKELMWAAIERLSTYDRMRKGMLRQVLDNGRIVENEVDIRKLGMQDKKLLMESILKDAEDDNERFLMRLRERIDRYQIFFR